jgi:hypothetical protein
MRAFNRLTWAILAFTTIPCQMHGQQHSGVASSDIEPGAIAALKKMGTYLRSLKTLQVRAETYKEDVLVDG